MFKQYIFIVGFIILGLIGGTSGNQVEASASFGDSNIDKQFMQNETPQYETNNWQKLKEQFFDRQSVNKQNDYGQEQKADKPEQPEQPEQNENVQNGEQDKGEENQVEQNDNNLHPFEEEVVELTNEEREKQGLTPLEIDEELSVVSKDKSKDMLDNQYFAHDSPTYGSPFDMMEKYGVSYRTAGENIAKGQSSAKEVVDGWMNSPGHRENILSDDFTHIGIGYIEEGNVWTQQFIGK